MKIIENELNYEITLENCISFLLDKPTLNSFYQLHDFSDNSGYVCSYKILKTEQITYDLMTDKEIIDRLMELKLVTPEEFLSIKLLLHSYTKN